MSSLFRREKIHITRGGQPRNSCEFTLTVYRDTVVVVPIGACALIVLLTLDSCTVQTVGQIQAVRAADFTLFHNDAVR